MKELSILLMDN